MKIQDDAILLYKNKRIFTLLTKNNGIVVANYPFKYSIDMFNKGFINIDTEKSKYQDNAYNIIRDFQIEFYLKNDLKVFTIGNLFSELIINTNFEDAYDLLLECILKIDNKNYKEVLLYFLFKMIKKVGLMQDLTNLNLDENIYYNKQEFSKKVSDTKVEKDLIIYLLSLNFLNLDKALELNFKEIKKLYHILIDIILCYIEYSLNSINFIYNNKII